MGILNLFNIYKKINLYDTTYSQQLHKAVHIVTILSIALYSSLLLHIIKLMGSVNFKNVNFNRSSQITLST